MLTTLQPNNIFWLFIAFFTVVSNLPICLQPVEISELPLK